MMGERIGARQHQIPGSRDLGENRGVGEGRNVPDGALWSLGVGGATADPSSIASGMYQLIQTLQNQTLAMEALRKRIEEREVEQRSAFSSRAVSVPFSYDPTKGPKTLNFGKVLKQRVNAISIVTAASGAALGADPRDSIIYGNFDTSIHVPDATGTAAFPRAEYPVPNSFEIILPIGGKLNQFAAVRDMDSLTVYSRTPFIGQAFITGGNPDVLPGL